MNVLVDSTIWSLALRRRRARLSADETRLVREWEALVAERRVAIIGMIRQEMLSGIAVPADYDRLRRALLAFEDLPVTTRDHERAAEHFNSCRTAGIQGSHTDFLICAVAERDQLAIFARDDDFARYATVLSIALHTVRADTQ